MSTVVLPPGKTDISDHANQTPSWHESLVTFFPYPTDLLKKLLVADDMPQLSFAITISL